jgi:hypothetical protein
MAKRNPTPAAAKAPKLLEASDLLFDAAVLVKAIWMAATSLHEDHVGPIQAICDAAEEKIESAKALL